MPTPGKDRMRAFRERQIKQGKTRISIALTPEARSVLDSLRAKHKDQSIDNLINRLLTDKIQSPCDENKEKATSPCDENKEKATSPCDEPSNRAELAVVGHRMRKEGKTLEAIAEQFNQAGWTPDRIPKEQGIKPRSDSSTQWTAKAVSQLLTRDYPEG